MSSTTLHDWRAQRPINQIRTQTPTTDEQRRNASAWTVDAVADLFELPFNDLLYRAQQVHRQHFDANAVQLSTLLSIKTGGCEEDCKYCPQSAHFDTGLKAEKLLPLDEVLEAARAAKQSGATRFCMGAAWRSPKERHLEQIGEMISGVKALGLETCLTAGMLGDGQAEQLRQAGLDYYNHNMEFAPARKHKACRDSGMSSRPADRRTMARGMVMRATAIVRTNSKGSRAAVPASGVPSTCTRLLMGTDSG